MASERLFGNRITPACRYCRLMVQIFSEGQVLCPKRGVVAADFSCRNFEYDPLKRVPKRPLPLEKYTQADFAL